MRKSAALAQAAKMAARKRKQGARRRALKAAERIKTRPVLSLYTLIERAFRRDAMMPPGFVRTGAQLDPMAGMAQHQRLGVRERERRTRQMGRGKA